MFKAKTDISTKDLVKQHGRLISIGVLLTFFSFFGQTAFIGVYIPDIEAKYNLSKTEVSFYYSLMTVLSAIAIAYTGKLLDQFNEFYVLCANFVLLAIGCLCLALPPFLPLLLLSFFLLRQCGQGYMGLAANTLINRYIDKGRGRATSYSKFGTYSYMAFIPYLALLAKENLSFDLSFYIYTGMSVFILIPLFAYLFKGHKQRREKYFEDKNTAEKLAENEISSDKTQLDVLKEFRFYLIALALTIAPCFMTAIFFFQEDIALDNDVSHELFTASFILMTGAGFVSNLVAGEMIDRIGEVLMLLMMPVLFALGLILFIVFDGAIAIWGGGAVLGLSVGIMGTLGGPLLAKLYGTKYLGGIKSLMFAIMVLSTALSPVLTGFLMDQGLSLNTIFMYFTGYIAIIWTLLVFRLKLTK